MIPALDEANPYVLAALEARAREAAAAKRAYGAGSQIERICVGILLRDSVEILLRCPDPVERVSLATTIARRFGAFGHELLAWLHDAHGVILMHALFGGAE